MRYDLFRREGLLRLDNGCLRLLRLNALEQLQHVVLLLVGASEVLAEVDHSLRDAVVPLQDILVPHLRAAV